MEATRIVLPYGLPLKAPFSKLTCKRNLGRGGRIKGCRKGLNFICKKKKKKGKREKNKTDGYKNFAFWKFSFPFFNEFVETRYRKSLRPCDGI
jgi:hypothetical protein